MGHTSFLINNFNAGVLSPKIDSRVDLEKYLSGCRRLENFIPLVEGGVTRMPGTYFVCEVKDSTKKTRLIPFEFSTVQQYVLEFGDQYIRFYKDGGLIVTTYAAWGTGTAYLEGALVTNSGYYRCLEAHTSGTFATDLAAGKWVETGGSTDLAYEIPSPYLEANLFNIKFFQSADIMWLCHPTCAVKQLSRTGHTAWTLTDFLTKTGDEMAITTITQASPAKVTCTTVPTSLETGDIVYIAGVAGMTELNGRFFTVASVVTGAAGNFTLVGENSTAYSAYTSDGTAQETIYGTNSNHPTCGALFEQRIAFGGAIDHPQTFVLSATADFNDFTLGDEDDDGMEFTIASGTIDRILWMVSTDFLAIGTVGGVYSAGASSSVDPFTQTNVSVRKFITSRIKNLQPESLTDSFVWTTRDGVTVQRLAYSTDEDRNVAVDMTRLAKHIAKGSTLALTGVSQFAFQSVPMPILWAVKLDGTLLGMTYESQENVFAWFEVITDGIIESIAVAGEENKEEQIWIIVKRTINGVDKRYVEYFKPVEFFSELSDCFYVHSGLTWEGVTATVESISLADPCVVTLSASHGVVATDKLRFKDTGTWLDDHIVTAHTVSTNDITIYTENDTDAINSSAFTAYVSGGTVETVLKTITGLEHLEGETVTALGDGAVIPSETVSSGSVVIDYWVNKIHIGLPYTSTVEPMKLSIGSAVGTSRGKLQKVPRVIPSFYETVGGKAGPTDSKLFNIPFGTGDVPELFTGDKVFEFAGDWEREATLVIVQDQPLPMTVLSIVSEIEIADR